MKALITGGAGFIGSHLADSLLKLGWGVAVIDDCSTGSLDNISHLIGDPKFSFAIADVRDEIVLDRIASQVDVIFHLAAAVGVKLIVDHPVHTIETNIMGTEAVLNTAKRYRCKVLIASTSEVYGKGAKIPFSEDDDVLLGATNKNRWAYAASKMVDEFLGLAYQQEFDIPVIPFRLFNTVGPRQTGQYGMVIPRLVRQAIRNDPLTVYGDGNQSRCFCYMGDIVKALVGLASHPDAPGRIYNIGSKEEISIKELAKLIKELLNSESEIIYVPYTEAYGPGFEDMQRRIPNTSRIEKLLGWKPETSLNEIIVEVAEYLSNQLKNK